MLSLAPLYLSISCSRHVIYLLPTYSSVAYILQVERDIVLWNNKIYNKQPVFAATHSDELLLKFRRWFAQFYSENSKEKSSKLKSADLSWWDHRRTRWLCRVVCSGWIVISMRVSSLDRMLRLRNALYTYTQEAKGKRRSDTWYFDTVVLNNGQLSIIVIFILNVTLLVHFFSMVQWNWQFVWVPLY